MSSSASFGLLIFLVVICSALADFQLQEGVPVVGMWIGPLNNVNERYRYDSITPCKEIPWRVYTRSLTETLLGEERVYAGIPLRFAHNEEQKEVCKIDSSSERLNLMKEAIHNNYWYELIVGDVPVWGMIGFEDEGEYFIYSHLRLSVSYKKGRIIHCNLTCENPVSMSDGDVSGSITYSVSWKVTSVDPKERYWIFFDKFFFSGKARLFSRLNSLFFVLFLLYSVRTLYINSIRSSKSQHLDEAGEKDVEAVLDSKWKILREDVFRAPSWLILFSSLYGVGVQFILLVPITCMAVLLTEVYNPDGNVLVSLAGFYVALTFFGCYASGSYYMRSSGRRWVRVYLLTNFIPPIAISLFIVPVSVLARIYPGMIRLTLDQVFSLLVLLVVNLILGLAGTLMGRKMSGQSSSSFKINKFKKPIPHRSILERVISGLFFCSLGPFCIVWLDFYYVYSSLWGYRMFYSYGDILFSFFLMFVASSSSAVINVFSMLNNEDYRVEWGSFMSGASIGVLVQIFSVYFFFTNTNMSGSYQLLYYFLSTTIFSLFFAIMSGTIGCIASITFTRTLYSSIKSD